MRKRYEVAAGSVTKWFFTYAGARKYFDRMKRFSRSLYWHSKTGLTVLAEETGTDIMRKCFPAGY